MRKIGLWLLVLSLLMIIPAHAETPMERLGQDSIVVYFSRNSQDDEASKSIWLENQVEGAVKSDNVQTIIPVSSLAEALMMMQSGRADAFFTLYPVAQYVESQQDGWSTFPGVIQTDLRIMVGEQQQDWLMLVNESLEAMQAEGVTDTLWATHVEAVLNGEEPAPIALPTIADAQTIRIGVSGDIPPIDYTTADGEPAGFNTAILAELAQRTGMNIECVSIESGARYTALASGRIDAFFWYNTFEPMDGVSDELFTYYDTNGTYFLSEPYSTVYLGWVVPAQE